MPHHQEATVHTTPHLPAVASPRRFAPPVAHRLTPHRLSPIAYRPSPIAQVATGDVAAALDTLYSAVEHVPSLRNMAQADAAALCSLEQEAPPPQCRVF